MNLLTDQDKQPFNSNWNKEYRIERDISEMLGLAKGILADGCISSDEVHAIRTWIIAHPDVCKIWPGDILAMRLQRIFKDGKVSQGEREDLHELLRELVGGKVGIIGTENAATLLPFDKPLPKLSFPNHTFVLTGKFAFGPRNECERFTQGAGGSCRNSVTRDVNYLLIGTFASRDWIHTSYGRKIEKAVAYRERGNSIAIIGEDHWATSLPISPK